ncbi:MAG: ABC transporter permease [Microbacteriaceae bacterium]
MNSIRRTGAIAGRVLRQIANDHRTVALMLVVPSLLVGLFGWMLNSDQAFANVGPRLVGLFPFMVMFLLASITTLRERQSGTLERYLTMPMKRAEFIIGYALAFGLMAIIQSAVTLSFAVFVLGLDVSDNTELLVLASVANAILGMSLGLFASAFAQSEFQVIQFLPAFIFPQIILGGLFVPHDQMPDELRAISDWLPLTHSLKALTDIAVNAATDEILCEIGIVGATSLGALLLGALTLRKKTP